MKTTPNSLQPLPLAVLKKLQQLRKTAERSLKECFYPGTDFLDHRRALEILRTCVMEDLNIRLDFYESLPGFDWSWMTQIATDATASTLACFPQNEFIKQAENGEIAYEEDRQFLDDLVRAVWDHAVSRRAASQPVPSATATIAQPEDRKALVTAYRAAFPNAAIIDICWAAQQHRREWDRWVKNELADGSKADRAFRLVLLGGKTATAVRKEIRPKNWK
jgi:hypothetical protein